MSEAGGAIIDLARVVMAEIIRAIQPEWTPPAGEHASILTVPTRLCFQKYYL